MNDESLKSALAAALKFISEGQPATGVALVDDLLTRYPLQRQEILRERSQAFAATDRFDEAFADRQTIISAGMSTAADCYFAGEYALQAGQFDEARQLFDQTVAVSLQCNSDYYVQSSRLLAALASYQLREDARCIRYLDLVDDKVEVLWLKGFDHVSKRVLLDVLKQQNP